MAESNASGGASYVSDQSIQQTGAEAGEAFAQMGMMLTRKYPKLSIFLGLISTTIFVYYGIENWNFHPVIFTLMSLFFLWLSIYFFITLVIIAAAIGIVGFIIAYLISLL